MKKHRLILLIFGLLILLLIAGSALAASASSASVSWYVLSAGGAPAESSSGNITLNGTLGQTAIGGSAAGSTSLWAGFWHSLGEVLRELFIPLVQRGGQP